MVVNNLCYGHSRNNNPRELIAIFVCDPPPQSRRRIILTVTSEFQPTSTKKKNQVLLLDLLLREMSLFRSSPDFYYSPSQKPLLHPTAAAAVAMMINIIISIPIAQHPFYTILFEFVFLFYKIFHKRVTKQNCGGDECTEDPRKITVIFQSKCSERWTLSKDLSESPF